MHRLNQLLANQSPERSDWGLPKVIAQLESAGFTIRERSEDYQKVCFYDIGAIAYYLKAIPWIIDDFTIDKYRGKFHELHLNIQKEGFFEDGYNTFMFIAEKPGTLK